MKRAPEVIKFFQVALNKIRERQQISQVRLSEKVGRSQSFTSQMETGRSEPTLTDLYLMSKILSCPVEEFFPVDVRRVTDNSPDQVLQWESEDVIVKTLVFNKKPQ